jgi:hypothetical protein
MQTATLTRSVYTKFGGHYTKGSQVEVDHIDIINDRILIKRVNYEGPIRVSLKIKDLILDVKWEIIRN